MRPKLKARSRVMMVGALLAFGVVFRAFAGVGLAVPSVPGPGEQASRGRILSADGTVLAESIGAARHYPGGSLAGQLIGIMGTDRGLEGIEATYDDRLAAGEDVRLTIDPVMQAAAESALAKYVPEHGGLYGSVVALESRTGKVLLSATYPPFSPGAWRDFAPELRRNRPFTDLFEPGSTAKGLSVAAALDAGLITPDTTYSTPMARPVPYPVGKKIAYKTIHDVVPHSSMLDTRGVLRYSSNVGMSHIVERFDRQRMYDYFRAYGFGQKMTVPRVYASTGMLRSPKLWDDVVRVNISFGQGVSATPLQLALAYNVLADGGVYRAPQLVEGDVSPEPPRQVIRPETSTTIRRLLRSVVEEGIPTAATVPGYSNGGKTGTAQAVIDGKYSQEVFDSVFAGFFPADRPRVTMVVMVHGATREYHGSQLAAPIFRDVEAQTVANWGEPPSQAVRDEQVAARKLELTRLSRR